MKRSVNPELALCVELSFAFRCAACGLRTDMNKISLRKVGSSYAITIPVETVKALHHKAGQKFEVSQENGRLVLTPVSPEFDVAMKAHEKVLAKYRAAFQKLADA